MAKMVIHNGVWRKPAEVERLEQAEKAFAEAREAEAKAAEAEIDARIAAQVALIMQQPESEKPAAKKTSTGKADSTKTADEESGEN